MTKKQRIKARCHKCNVDAVCPKCKETVDMASPFSLWLREQPEIDSSVGYSTTNLDYVWCNYLTSKWMLIEEKTYGKDKEDFSQRQLFSTLDRVCRNDKNYKGYHLLVFENTTPENGRVWVNGQERDKDSLIRFLKFEWAMNR